MFIFLKKNDRHEKAVNPSVWLSVLLKASRRSGIRPDRYLLIRCFYTTIKVVKRQMKIYKEDGDLLMSKCSHFARICLRRNLLVSTQGVTLLSRVIRESSDSDTISNQQTN
jgi:hypothetical protein